MAISIGPLSERTGVKIPTIRYYEQIGLITEGARTAGNQRRYGTDTVDQLKFVRHARDLGFAIEAIRQLLDMSASPQSSCHRADSIARAHLADIESRITQLASLKAELARMISECSHGRISECRVISVLADHEKCLLLHHR